jgi:hypothetical protein
MNMDFAGPGKIILFGSGKPDRMNYYGPLSASGTGSTGGHDLVENRNRQTNFIRVPQQLAESWGASFGDMAIIEEERGHWDYLYAASDLAALKGNRYHKKKNLLNQFIKKYDYTYVPFEAELIEQAMAMQEDWCTWRDCESSDILFAENQSISRIFKSWDQLSGTLGGAILVNGAMVAYTVAEG